MRKVVVYLLFFVISLLAIDARAKICEDFEFDIVIDKTTKKEQYETVKPNNLKDEISNMFIVLTLNDFTLRLFEENRRIFIRNVRTRGHTELWWAATCVSLNVILTSLGCMECSGNDITICRLSDIPLTFRLQSLPYSDLTKQDPFRKVKIIRSQYVVSSKKYMGWVKECYDKLRERKIREPEECYPLGLVRLSNLIAFWLAYINMQTAEGIDYTFTLNVDKGSDIINIKADGRGSGLFRLSVIETIDSSTENNSTENPTIKKKVKGQACLEIGHLNIPTLQARISTQVEALTERAKIQQTVDLNSLIPEVEAYILQEVKSRRGVMEVIHSLLTGYETDKFISYLQKVFQSRNQKSQSSLKEQTKQDSSSELDSSSKKPRKKVK